MTFCLDSIILKPEDNAEIKNAIILLHGYGGDGKDISLLSLNWKRHLTNTIFICPDGHETCPVNPSGYQWFDFINKFEPIKQVHAANLKDPWTIIFTSGTTGTPKGVVLSYGANDETKVLTQDSNPLKINFDGDNHFFSYLPLNHIAERIVVEHTCFRFGGTISFTESLETFAQNLQVTQPTVFFAVPRIWTKFQLGILGKLPQKKLSALLRIPLISGLLKNKFKKALGLSRARAKVSGAAPMQESQRVWFRKIGIDITNGYGMTENCAITTQLDGKITNKPGSVGLAQTGVELKIDHKNGEILMRGPFLMDGYYKDKISEVFLKNNKNLFIIYKRY